MDIFFCLQAKNKKWKSNLIQRLFVVFICVLFWGFSLLSMNQSLTSLCWRCFFRLWETILTFTNTSIFILWTLCLVSTTTFLHKLNNKWDSRVSLVKRKEGNWKCQVCFFSQFQTWKNKILWNSLVWNEAKKNTRGKSLCGLELFSILFFIN